MLINIAGYMCSGKSTLVQKLVTLGMRAASEGHVSDFAKEFGIGDDSDTDEVRALRQKFLGALHPVIQEYAAIVAPTKKYKKGLVIQTWQPQPLPAPWINIFLDIWQPEKILTERASYFATSDKPQDKLTAHQKDMQAIREKYLAGGAKIVTTFQMLDDLVNELFGLVPERKVESSAPDESGVHEAPLEDDKERKKLEVVEGSVIQTQEQPKKEIPVRIEKLVDAAPRQEFREGFGCCQACGFQVRYLSADGLCPKCAANRK